MRSSRMFKLFLIMTCLCVFLTGCGSPSGATEPAEGATKPPESQGPSATATPTSEPEPPTATPTLSPTAEAFLGEWVGVDQDSGGWSWFTIRREGDEAVMHLWGQCYPAACDAGFTRFPITDLDDGGFTTDRIFGNGTEVSEFILLDDMSIEVTSILDYTEASGIQDRTEVNHFQNALEVSGIPSIIGTWVYDQAVESEFTVLSVMIDVNELIIQAKAIIDGQEIDLGETTELDRDSDDSFYVDFEYPGGGLISGECRAGGDGTLIVAFFSEHMVDNVYTPHESVFVMHRMD